MKAIIKQVVSYEIEMNGKNVGNFKKGIKDEECK